eukprot:Gb_11460 [translate_table: standard]
MTFKSIVYILLVLLFLSPTSSFCNKEDIEALLALKKAISNNTHGALDSWNPYNTSHPCNWTGISCTSTTNRVSNITLPAKNLSGRLVAELSNLTYLVHLELALNSFRGAIPSELGNLRALKVLDLNYNQLEGEIPSELGSLQSLQILNLGNNFNICGSIPSSLGQLKQLNTLSLLNNLLSGNIPPEIGQMPNLQYMFLSDNKLSGEIPEELGSISQLTYLSLEFNELSGSIPSQLGRLTKLQFLSLSGNQLSGTIPSELARLNDLRSLLLDSNRLSGEIPNEFGLLHNLQNLHLFSNRLSGGHIDTLSSVPYEGNPNLCGTIISKPCLVKHSNITLERAHKKRASQNLIITVVASPTIAGAILIGFIIFYYWIRWRGSTNSHDVKILDIENGLKLMASDLFECTYGYSNANIIGRGSLSTVYKGILGSGHVYALKVFKVDEHENNIELVRSNFVNECKVLSQIRHRNIVRILGAYSDAHRKILVLPFMPNGSLDMHLHGSDTCHLTWEMRLKIASEVAQAMVYLHEESGVGQIVHCDLKPSNILLDQDFVAHVSDFGMASWVVDPNLNAPATFRGTIGYIAPETAYASKVSASMDVYGYGILLLEMVTRKRPTLSNEILNGKASSLHEWVQLLFADRLLEVVDPMLISNATTSTHDQIISVVKLGLSCSQQSPNHRPSMRVVMTKLQQITVPSSD